MAKELVITLKRSIIGKIGKHKEVVKGLGLKRPNETVIRKDTPEIRGMINKVAYLLDVEEKG
ncbi:MAG: 50S ribosomal protein L30 [Nitrospirota bacterium]|jgi:large subunit ribosomal protein L30|nr:50S ribosomal protein L30 [Nitrospirota bacterium]